MKRSLISITEVGSNKGAPRIWFESNRLKSLGFDVASRMSLKHTARGLRLETSNTGDRVVSGKRGIPVIDLNSRRALFNIESGETVKVSSSFGRIEIVPTVRTFHVREAKAARKQYRLLECFAGGGTFHDAISGLDRYVVKGALELEARYLNIYDRKACEVETLLHGDIRNFEPDDMPRHDILCAGLPCTDHSLQGRSKKGLKTPENGEVGNLFMDLMPVIRHHRPLGVVIENVPSYLTSEAGTCLIRTLSQWGYSVTSQIIDPVEWGEITSRKRLVIVATQRGAFHIAKPAAPHQYRLNDFLDPEMPELDKADAERDAHSVAFLTERSRKMAAKGNGWRHHVFSRDHQGLVPTITRGYMKRQPQSWMVETPYGPRMLRQGEIARLHGHTFPDDISKTLSVEMSGQGVMSRVFRDIFTKLADFLDGEYVCPVIESDAAEDQLQLFAS
jgi:DNA (cytosine-5)-methyltransferase 1